MKSSLDVFYFNVPCLVHNLINWDSQMTKDEFKKFWDMIGSEKQYSLEFRGNQLY